jgi:hypothetical protein
MGCISALSKLTVIAIALAVAISAAQGPEAQRNTTLMWVCLGIAVVVSLTLFRGRPSRCSMCDNVLRRTSYKWKIDGKTRYLCPHCNQRMERQQSAEGFDAFKSRRRR